MSQENSPEPGASISANTPVSSKKKIILCCDGTWNSETFPRPSTNVLRISRCISPFHNDGTPQIVYYQPGVGTGTSWLGNRIEGATGRGLYENILEAYSFVCHNYNSNDDEIYLLGFSRGAFTARCIAQFICEVGLLTKAGLFDMLDLFSLWKKRAYVKLGSKCSVLEIGGRLRPGIAIHACAVWDTVSSFGLPMVAGLPQLGPARLEFVNSNLCPGIRKAFQALSLHEHRRSFHPIVWKLPGKDDERLKQCWFLGYHSDIGGGNEKEGLAHLPLVWIISQIKDFLCFNREDLWSSPGIGWRLSDALKKPGSRVEVEDPKKGVFALGGSKYRKPCCHFYEQRRLSDEPAEPDASKSNERIHLTVRTLLEKKAVAPCKPLHNIPISQDENKKVVWKFPKTARSAEYTVKEDEMSKFELDLLKNWLQIEEAHPDSEKVDNMISGLLIDVEEELERQRRAVIDWIAPSQSPTHYGHLDHHVKGTNDEWFFHNNKFQDWVDGDGKTISCVGGIGSGKTIIVSKTVEKLQAEFGPAKGVMVVFVYGGAGSGAGSGDGITDRVSPVASLLRQAVAQSKKLPEVAGELYANSRMRNDPPTEREMVGVLCTVMAEFKKSYVLVDALDEFSRKSRNQLLEVLRRLRSQSKISLNILFTSRAIPLHHIFEAWQPPDIIKLTISMPESELEILVKDLLPRKFRDWRPDFLTEIVKKVVMVSAGRPLFAKIISEELGRCRIEADVRDFLEHPSSPAIDELYGRVLDSLRPKSGNGESIGLRTLLFLSVTARPLSEREAVQAISSKSRTLDDILAECAGMVVFDADKDQLLAEHPMCLDFLCSPQLDLFPDGHVRVLTTCLSFLSMEIEPTAPSTEQLLTEYPFLAYAARWWLYHAHRDERPSLIGPFLENEVARERWLAIWERLDPQSEPGVDYDEDDIPKVRSVIETAHTPREVAELLGLEQTAGLMRLH